MKVFFIEIFDDVFKTSKNKQKTLKKVKNKQKKLF